jgi:hypothetical protein
MLKHLNAKKTLSNVSSNDSFMASSSMVACLASSRPDDPPAMSFKPSKK